MASTEDFSNFLRKTLPDMGYSWRRFERRNIRRRVLRRMDLLGIREMDRYALLLAADPGEKALFESFLRITITRFFRNAPLWSEVRRLLLEKAAESGEQGPVAWSAGCAGGEEPFSLAMLLLDLEEAGHPVQTWRVMATDADPSVLRRATENSRYAWGSVCEVPPEILRRWFQTADGAWILDPSVTNRVTFLRHDLLREKPPWRCSLVLLRNSVLTYNTEQVQRRVLEGVRSCLEKTGILVTGRTEMIPDGWGWEKVAEMVYRKKQS